MTFTMPPNYAREWGRTLVSTEWRPAMEQTEDAPAKAREAAKRRLMKLALVVEPDNCRLSEWWAQTPIVELGSHTANELVAQGKGNLVEKFLITIIFGDRD